MWTSCCEWNRDWRLSERRVLQPLTGRSNHDRNNRAGAARAELADADCSRALAFDFFKKGTEPGKELKSLKQVEKQRRQARNAKRMRGELGTGQVTKVCQTDEDGTRTVCETQETMVKAFFEENDARFSQTESTPPMQALLVNNLGCLAETKMAEKALEGTYKIPQEVDKCAPELLQEPHW